MTLSYCSREIISLNSPSAVACAVLLNKDKPKVSHLPAGVPEFIAEQIKDIWVVFPWDSYDIYQHQKIAHVQEAHTQSKEIAKKAPFVIHSKL